MSVSKNLEKYRHVALLLACSLAFFITLSLAPLLAQDGNTSSLKDDIYSVMEDYTPELVTVGDPGNSADARNNLGLGSVNEIFQIGKYPVTVQQWANFLNSVKVIQNNDRDPRNLFHKEMFNADNSFSCLITGQTVRKPDKSYDKNDDQYDTFYVPRILDNTVFLFNQTAALPVTGISLNDAKRYCNWLHHGHPYIEKLDETTIDITETGAYDFKNGNGELMEGALFFIPPINYWYKAAYYKGGAADAGYWRYPTSSDELPPNILLSSEADRSNYYQYGKSILDSWNSPKAGYWTGANFAIVSHGYFSTKKYYTGEMPYLTPVGFFHNSPGAYGTYDMGGNVREWISDSQEKETSTALGGSWDETSDELLYTHNIISPKTSFDVSGSNLIGLRICARISDTNNPYLPERGIDPEQEKEIRQLAKDKDIAAAIDQLADGLFWTLFLSSLGVSAGMETLATSLEITVGFVEGKTWVQISESFTWRRLGINVGFCIGGAFANTMNAILHIKTMD